MGELLKLVEEGKIKYIGLSEACGATILRAHAAHPITAVQIEWSLWSRGIEEELVPSCRELGIGIVAYSPLGRGFFLVGPKLVDKFCEGDLRKNTYIFERVSEMAAKKGCTASQLALAWVHHRGDDDGCPLPGTSKLNNLNDDIATLSMELKHEELFDWSLMLQLTNVKGDRIGTKTFT